MNKLCSTVTLNWSLNCHLTSNLSEIVKYVYYVYFTSQPLEQTDKTIILDPDIFLKLQIQNHDSVFKKNAPFYSAPLYKLGRWIMFKNVLSS